MAEVVQTLIQPLVTQLPMMAVHLENQTNMVEVQFQQILISVVVVVVMETTQP